MSQIPDHLGTSWQALLAAASAFIVALGLACMAYATYLFGRVRAPKYAHLRPLAAALLFLGLLATTSARLLLGSEDLVDLAERAFMIVAPIGLLYRFLSMSLKAKPKL